MSKISFIIPCYRSEKTLAHVVEEIRETMRGLAAYEYDIFLVNDCSPDDTFAVIRRLCSQYDNIKAPHFVTEVKKQLEEKYGMITMRTGGYTIVTTLDYRAQEMAEAAVASGAQYMKANGTDNIAMASVDVETSQVIAMVGSVDWKTPVYGEVNAMTSLLEPGSSIKPLLDYAPLFSSS